MEAQYDYLIIGGGIAGITAAEAIREKDDAATIGVISDEPHLLYSRVLLPAYVKKRIPREKVFLRRVEDFIEKKIDIRLEEEVAKVRPEEYLVELVNHRTIGYKKLCIASGGRVRPWGNPADQKMVYRLQTLDDADRLFSHLSEIHDPLVIGSSFIGLEFLEIFTVWGVRPRIIMRSPHFFGTIFDVVGSQVLKENFSSHGIIVDSEDTIMEIAHHEEYAEAVTTKGKRIHTDAVAVGVGLDLSLGFLVESGVLTKRGVVVNEFLETNKKDVFAAGDVAEYYDVILGKHSVAGNWTSAFLQGKRAGLNMVGIREPYKNVSAYSITNLGLQITVFGDCSSDIDTIVRFGKIAGKDQYARLFLKSGILAGAALINRFQDKPHLAKLIEAKADLEPYRDNLQDINFDIKSIAAV